MDTVSHSPTQTQKHVANRNDSGWDDGGALIENFDSGAQVPADEETKNLLAFQWPGAQDKGPDPVSPGVRSKDVGFSPHEGVATPSSLLGRNGKRGVRTSFADGRISPGTTTPLRNPLSISYRLDNKDDTVSSLRRATPIHLIQPRRKSTATVGAVQKSTSAASELSVQSVSEIVCVEESPWHRNKPSRLLSYASISTSSSKDFGEALTSHPNPRSPIGSSSPDEYMIVEEDPSTPPRPSAPASPSDSRKSHKFTKKKKNKKSKLRAPQQARPSSSAKRTSREDSFKSALTHLEDPRALGPSRHYSYGATLDLPPIGLRTSRDDPQDCKTSEAEAMLEDPALVVVPPLMAPTLRQLEAQMEFTENEPLTTFQK